jgi:hypothetical protein
MGLVAQSLQEAQSRVGGGEKNRRGGVAQPELFALLCEANEGDR